MIESRFYRHCFAFAVLVIGVIAQIPASAQSLFTFDALEQGRIVYTEQQRKQSYQLALSPYKKTNNRWQSDNQFRLAGTLSRQTVEFSRNFNSEEVFQRYFQQLTAKSSYVLSDEFYCEGRDCGSSNVWANNHFNVRQLYGLDQYQYYGVYRWRSDAKAPLQYIVIYSVRRGNGRVFAQLEVFQPDNPVENMPISLKALQSQLEDKGFWVLPLTGKGLEVSLGDDILNLVRQLFLSAEKNSHYALVGHYYRESDQTAREQASKEIAERVLGQLKEADANISKVSAYGVGGLSPRANYPSSQRLELVVTPER